MVASLSFKQNENSAEIWSNYAQIRLESVHPLGRRTLDDTLQPDIILKTTYFGLGGPQQIFSKNLLCNTYM